jgi:PAS domain S-box-containing protein
MTSRSNEKRLQYFAEATSDYFWEIDTNLRYVFVSTRVLDVLGFPPEHFLGKTLEETGIRRDLGDANWRRHLSNLEAHLPFRNVVVPRM